MFRRDGDVFLLGTAMAGKLLQTMRARTRYLPGAAFKNKAAE